MAKLRTFKSLVNNRYVLQFVVDQQSISQTDRELVAKFGEPEIQVGGTYFGGATATANVSGGAVVGFNLLTTGNNYSSAPVVGISGVGSGATATALMDNGRVIGFTVTNGGSGYTSAPTVVIAEPDEKFTVPDETTRIFSGMPYTRSLDATVEPFVSYDPEVLANGYKTEIQRRWTEAIESLRDSTDIFSGEELTEI